MQSEFLTLIAKLILHANSLGYEVTAGDAYRDPRVTYGHPKSTHRVRLAMDLNLFRDGVYLKKSEDHLPLGEWWEKQHTLARWGGRFKNSKGQPAPDGNHYSFFWDGVS